MVNHPAAVARYMLENSTSWMAKVQMAEQTYLGDPDAELSMKDIEFVGKKNLEAISAYNYMLDTELLIDLEEAPPDEYFYD